MQSYSSVIPIDYHNYSVRNCIEQETEQNFKEEIKLKVTSKQKKTSTNWLIKLWRIMENDIYKPKYGSAFIWDVQSLVIEEFRHLEYTGRVRVVVVVVAVVI